MSWIIAIAVIIIDLFSTYGFYIIIDGCMKKSNRRINTQWFWLCYLAFYIATVVRYLLLSQSDALTNLILTLLSVFALCLLYKGSVLRRLLVTGLSYCLYAFGDIGVALIISAVSKKPIFELLDSDPWLNVLGVILSASIFLILAFFCTKIYQKSGSDDSSIELPRVYLFVAVLLPILSIAVAALLISTAYNDGILSVPAICLCVILIISINILVLNLYNQLLKEQGAKIRNAMIEQQNCAYVHEIHLMQQASQQIRTLRHDMKNHIFSIQEMLHAGRTEDIKKYLNRFIKEITSTREYLNTGIAELDSMVNYKLAQAKMGGTEIQVNSAVPMLEREELDPFDLSIIMGNLLDNAIEGVCRTNDKKIFVGVKFSKGVFHIQVNNTYDGIAIKSNETEPKYKTRKNHSGEHGIGLTAIANIVKKYNGLMDISDSDEIFKVHIILYPYKA